MDAKEQSIRELYAARARGDWDTVRSLLADDVVWHEPGEEDYSGDYHAADDVVAMLERLVEVTEGTFELVPQTCLNAVEHSAVLLRWWAVRDSVRCEGNEIVVYRFAEGKIVEAWFYPDGYDPATFTAVFGYTDSTDSAA